MTQPPLPHSAKSPLTQDMDVEEAIALLRRDAKTMKAGGYNDDCDQLNGIADLLQRQAAQISNLRGKLEEAERAREVSDLYHGLNGHDIAEAEKRADHIMFQMLEGTRVGDGTRMQVRHYLVEHFKTWEALAQRKAKLQSPVHQESEGK